MLSPLLAVLTAPAWATTLHVDPAGGGDVLTIADASALLADGDTLVLSEGDHTGCLRLDGRSLTIEGQGAELTRWTAGACTEQVRARDGESVTLRGLTLSNPSGRAVAVLGGVLLMEDVAVVDSGDPGIDGGGVWVRTGESVLRRVVFEGNQARLGGGFYPWDGGSATLEDCTFRNNHATEQGGGAYANGGVAGSILRTTFDNNSSDDVSGGLGWHLGTLEIWDSVFEGNTAAVNGGAVYAHHATAPIVIAHTRFVANTASAGRGGALYGAYGSTFALTDTSFADNSATQGADLAIFESALVLDRAVSTGAIADEGGLLWLSPGAEADLHDVAVCGVDAAGALLWSGGTATLNNVLVHDGDGVGIVVEAGRTEARQVGLSTLRGGGLSVFEGASALLQNSVMVDVIGGTTVDSLGELDLGHNTWWALDDEGATPGDGSLRMDPRWVGGDDCALSIALPTATSPLVDAGDPTVLDPDGTRSDIGPWGGPGSPMVDGDGDGAWTVQDCDDDEATVFPGAEEVPADGVDQDCDGMDSGEPDPDTVERPDTEDEDGDLEAVGTDGAPDRPTEKQGRGCAVGGVAGAWLPAMLMLGWRRRGH